MRISVTHHYVSNLLQRISTRVGRILLLIAEHSGMFKIKIPVVVSFKLDIFTKTNFVVLRNN
jgi:hypothetical protein